MTSDRQPGGVAKAYGRKYVEFDTLPGAVRVALYGRGASPGTPGPRPVRVRDDPEDVHVAGAGLDHEQAVQALEGHRAVDVEEVGGQHGRGVRAQEVPPGLIGVPFRRRRDPQGLEDAADGGGAGPVAELEQLALDALVSPAMVLGGEPPGERGDLGTDRWTSGLVRVGPLLTDQATMSSQNGAGRD
jgi:hypothetical protein